MPTPNRDNSSDSGSSGSSSGSVFASAAAAAAVAKHARLQALAAARTREAAVAMVNSRRARQRKNMRPVLLDEGDQVRVSFLYSPKVRRLLKDQHGSGYLPKWTVEVYTVVGRSLAPGSRRVVLYHVKVEGDGKGSGRGSSPSGEQLAEGSQVPCQVGRAGSRPVQLHLELRGVDRRWLQPVPVTVSTAGASAAADAASESGRGGEGVLDGQEGRDGLDGQEGQSAAVVVTANIAKRYPGQRVGL